MIELHNTRVEEVVARRVSDPERDTSVGLQP